MNIEKDLQAEQESKEKTVKIKFLRGTVYNFKDVSAGDVLEVSEKFAKEVLNHSTNNPKAVLFVESEQESESVKLIGGLVEQKDEVVSKVKNKESSLKLKTK